MTAVSWSAIGLMAATLFGVLFFLGGKIDSLNTSLASRIDAQGASLASRIDAQGASLTNRFDALSARIDGLSARMDTHLDRHTPQGRAR